MRIENALMSEPKNIAFQSDEREYRQALGRFATGIAVVTIGGGGSSTPLGLTVNSFTSISLSPKLVLVSIDRRSSTLPALLSKKNFAVNVLSCDQRGLSQLFAGKAHDKFDGLEYRVSSRGNPVFQGSLAWFDCKLYRSIEAGDHIMILGEVESHDYDAGDPLLYFAGSYKKIQ